MTQCAVAGSFEAKLAASADSLLRKRGYCVNSGGAMSPVSAVSAAMAVLRLYLATTATYK